MIKKNDFKPAWWLPGPHLQTLWPSLLKSRRAKNLVLRRERIELPDGDFVDLDWVVTPSTGPIVLILHGLEGSADSSYAQGMLQAAQKQGWRAVVMHFRGCSGEFNRLPRLYHSGDTGDLERVVQMICQREPDVMCAAIGFSLGGNVLLKWLGETGSANPLSAAVAISVPFDLGKSVDRLQRGFSQVYERHLLRCLQVKVAKKFQGKKAPITLSSLEGLRSIREFDDQITAPLHGFGSADAYYQESSSRQFLKHIQVPTLLLHAKDDPFMTQEVIPTPAELSSSVILEVSEAGGHVGFVGGRFPWRPEYWLDKRIPAFLMHYLF